MNEALEWVNIMNGKMLSFTPKMKTIYVIRNPGSLILKIMETSVLNGLSRAQLFASTFLYLIFKIFVSNQYWKLKHNKNNDNLCIYFATSTKILELEALESRLQSRSGLR